MLSYVDDTAFLAIGRTFEDTHWILADMMTRDGGAIQWSKDHNSHFKPSKFTLLDFTQTKEADPLRPRKKCPLARPPLINPSLVTIQPSLSAHYLGVLLDQELC